MRSILPKNETMHNREVWSDNIEVEFALIREIVDDFPYIAMDTEFPRIVSRPLVNFKTSSDFNYATLKANVYMLKLIQLRLTFSDDEGNFLTCGTDRDNDLNPASNDLNHGKEGKKRDFRISTKNVRDGRKRKRKKRTKGFCD